jgi:threonyl-tRNA synthetase
VLPVSGKFAEYAEKVTKELQAAGFRVHYDDRNEKLQAKIRDAQMQKIPYMLIIGGKEAEAGTVSVRHRTKGDLGPRPLEQFSSDLRQEIDAHAIG